MKDSREDEGTKGLRRRKEAGEEEEERRDSKGRERKRE